MTDRLVAEIEQQHQLLARWLGTAADPEVLAELRAAHTDDFSMVTADGQVLALDALVENLRKAAYSNPGVRILISQVTVVAQLPGAVLARFLETHVAHRHTASRQVTALFVEDERARNGLRWRYLHETLIAD